MSTDSSAFRVSFASRQEAATMGYPHPPKRRSRAKKWRIGQRLSAVVLQVHDDHRAILDIQSFQITATVPAEVSVGTRLRLEVRQTQPDVILEVIEMAAADGLWLHKAIRSLLPRQMPLTKVLANIGYMVQSPDDKAAHIPVELQRIAKHVYTTIPNASRLGFGDAVKQALKHSGMFLEPQLRRANVGQRHTIANVDFKAGLLRFAVVAAQLQLTKGTNDHDAAATRRLDYPPLKDSPAQAQPRALPSMQSNASTSAAIASIKGQIDGALARIHLLQLNAHNAYSTHPFWLFELPVRHKRDIDLWQLRVQRDSARDKTDITAPKWMLTASVCPDNEGPVYAKIVLQGFRVSVKLWAKSPETCQRYNDALAQLNELLEANGFDVTSISCHSGEPKTDEHDRSRLLDLKA